MTTGDAGTFRANLGKWSPGRDIVFRRVSRFEYGGGGGREKSALAFVCKCVGECKAWWSC